MADLMVYRKVNIFFFGNEQEKNDFYQRCIIPFFRASMTGRYFTTRDWNGGPNVEVIYRGERISKRALLACIRCYVKKEKLVWTEEQLQQNLGIYRRNMSDMAQMEKKKEVPVRTENHLKVSDRKLSLSYYRKVYNSSEHIKTHFESRMLLQPLLEQSLATAKDDLDLNMIVIKNMQMILQLYEYGEKYASMVFFSNMTGVFGIAKQYGKEEAFRAYFEKEHAKYCLSDLDKGFGHEELISEFQKTWKHIYQMCSTMVDDGLLNEKGYYRLSDQEEQMKKNISGVDSEFHQRMYRDTQIHTMVSGRTHLIFRSLINILYNTMNTLQIGFLRKNSCIFEIVEYIKEKYDTDWDQIMDERVIS